MPFGYGLANRLIGFGFTHESEPTTDTTPEKHVTGATEGMVGGGFYDAHSSFQAKVAASGAALLEQAVAALTMPADGEAMVADYGCSEGRNSMATIATALQLLAARGARGFGVLHNDLPSNDWDSLAKNLASPSS